MLLQTIDDDFKEINMSDFSSDPQTDGPIPTLSEEQIEALTAVQIKHMDTLMSYPNVVGVGIGFARKDDQPTNEPAIIVMVNEKLPVAQLDEHELLPREVDGVRVDVQETGGFFAG
jgi:hypothetical protein